MNFKIKLPKQYEGAISNLSLYWKSYGGSFSLICSPYFHVALLFTYIAHPFWTGSSRKVTWYDLALTSLPNLLGFTLGGYAILLAFGDDRFRKIISGRRDGEACSPFIGINSTFIHFIIVQVIAIMSAVIGSAWQIENGKFAFFGFLFFSYSIMTAVAAAMSVLRLSHWFDIWSSTSESPPKNKTGSKDI